MKKLEKLDKMRFYDETHIILQESVGFGYVHTLKITIGSNDGRFYVLEQEGLSYQSFEFLSEAIDAFDQRMRKRSKDFYH